MSKALSLDSLQRVQQVLEDSYDLKTGLDIRDFVLPESNFKELGKLEVVQKNSENNDIDLAVIFDRDILSAFNGSGQSDINLQHRATSVVFEEVSHFVYLAFNHYRGRNITRLEMEIQSEVDRILLAYNSSIEISNTVREALWIELLDHNYSDKKYEESRLAAIRFIRGLKSENPAAWSRNEKEALLRFFHGDLGEKLFLAKP
jgi:hypothetical protein